MTAPAYCDAWNAFHRELDPRDVDALRVEAWAQGQPAPAVMAKLSAGGKEGSDKIVFTIVVAIRSCPNPPGAAAEFCALAQRQSGTPQVAQTLRAGVSAWLAEELSSREPGELRQSIGAFLLYSHFDGGLLLEPTWPSPRTHVLDSVVPLAPRMVAEALTQVPEARRQIAWVTLERLANELRALARPPPVAEPVQLGGARVLPFPSRASHGTVTLEDFRSAAGPRDTFDAGKIRGGDFTAEDFYVRFERSRSGQVWVQSHGDAPPVLLLSFVNSAGEMLLERLRVSRAPNTLATRILDETDRVIVEREPE